VRWRAAYALGHIGSEAAIPALLKAIEDSNEHVRWRAAEALGHIGSEAAIPALLKAIEDSSESVRWSTAYALGQLKDDLAAHILPTLLTLLPTLSGKEAFYAIQGIQANCKYYNYEIFQAALEAQNVDRQTQNSDRSNITYDLRGATIANLAHEVHGNQTTQSQETQ